MKNAEFGSFLCCAKGNGRQKATSYFSLGLFYAQRFAFNCECTQIKANRLQFWLSLWLKGKVASTVREGKNSSDCAGAACVHKVKLCYFDNAACILS